MNRVKRIIFWKFALLMAFMIAPSASVAGPQEKVRGQTVYASAYSHIFGGDKVLPVYLTVTLSIRNTSTVSTLSIDRVDYYDSDGALLKHYLESPVRLKPLASRSFIVKESDKSGGEGANFIVQWSADAPVLPPIIETVMIGTRSQQGISFVGRSRVIEEVPAESLKE